MSQLKIVMYYFYHAIEQFLSFFDIIFAFMTSFGVEFFYVYVERVLKMYLPNHKKTLLVKRFAGSWKELSLPELNQNAKISVLHLEIEKYLVHF